MDFLDVLNKRRACHNFVPGKTIPDDDLVTMIEQASLSPSGYNAQPWEFIVIREQETIHDVYEIAYKQEHLKNCSAIIMVLADQEIGRHADDIVKDWEKYGYRNAEQAASLKGAMTKKTRPEKKEMMAIRNAAMAGMTLIYAAENIGYATCPMMGFPQIKLKHYLNLPDDRKFALMIAIGYEDPNAKKLERLPRKKSAETIHWEKY